MKYILVLWKIYLSSLIWSYYCSPVPPVSLERRFHSVILNLIVFAENSSGTNTNSRFKYQYYLGKDPRAQRHPPPQTNNVRHSLSHFKSTLIDFPNSQDHSIDSGVIYLNASPQPCYVGALAKINSTCACLLLLNFGALAVAPALNTGSSSGLKSCSIKPRLAPSPDSKLTVLLLLKLQHLVLGWKSLTLNIIINLLLTKTLSINMIHNIGSSDPWVKSSNRSPQRSKYFLAELFSQGFFQGCMEMACWMHMISSKCQCYYRNATLQVI